MSQVHGTRSDIGKGVGVSDLLQTVVLITRQKLDATKAVREQKVLLTRRVDGHGLQDRSIGQAASFAGEDVRERSSAGTRYLKGITRAYSSIGKYGGTIETDHLDFTGASVAGTSGISALRVKGAAAFTGAAQVLEFYRVNVGTVGTLGRGRRDGWCAGVTLLVDALNGDLWDKHSARSER